jgi:predicted permease
LFLQLLRRLLVELLLASLLLVQCAQLLLFAPGQVAGLGTLLEAIEVLLGAKLGTRQSLQLGRRRSRIGRGRSSYRAQIARRFGMCNMRGFLSLNSDVRRSREMRLR